MPRSPGINRAIEHLTPAPSKKCRPPTTVAPIGRPRSGMGGLRAARPLGPSRLVKFRGSGLLHRPVDPREGEGCPGLGMLLTACHPADRPAPSELRLLHAAALTCPCR